MHFIICLTDVLEYFQVVKNGIIIVFQIMLDSLSDRKVQTFIIRKTFVENGMTFHSDFMLFHVLFGSLTFETAT